MIREAVLDHPEIELRLWGNDTEVSIAEIAFPRGTTVSLAKRFLYEQLGKILLRPCGAACWEESAEQCVVKWPAAATNPGEWISIDEGIRENIAGTGLAAFTAAVAFDRTAGWTLEAAQEWLAGNLCHGVGRAVILS